MKTTWDFVEEYYPNYTGSSLISYSDDLEKILNSEWEEGDSSWEVLQKEFDGNPNDPKILCEYHEVMMMIYESSIENYIKKLNNPIG